MHAYLTIGEDEYVKLPVQQFNAIFIFCNLLDVTRRINLLKEEAARIAENTTLTHVEKNKINAAKYSAMMAPIVVVLERRLTSTSQKPETPHEFWFFEEYQEQIKSAVLKFKTPPASIAALGELSLFSSSQSASLMNICLLFLVL